MRFMQFLVVVIACVMILLFNNSGNTREENSLPRKQIKHGEYKTLTLDIGFKSIYPDPSFEYLTMPGKVTAHGVGGDIAKFARALRFENITNAVEDKYNLPRGIILSMVVIESTGVDLLPNGSNDGGFGLCHMQPIIAKEFGLNTYAGCNKLVCKDHAVKLENILVKHHYDRKDVVEYDDRLHPIKNLDAVGRMLAYYMEGPRIKDLGPLRTAICRYAGRYNYPEYWASVCKNMKLLEDESFRNRVERDFNTKNSKLIINNKEGDWKEYLRVSQEQNYNYGLAEYEKSEKYLPRNSDAVQKTYKKYL